MNIQAVRRFNMQTSTFTLKAGLQQGTPVKFGQESPDPALKSRRQEKARRKQLVADMIAARQGLVGLVNQIIHRKQMEELSRQLYLMHLNDIEAATNKTMRLIKATDSTDQVISHFSSYIEALTTMAEFSLGGGKNSVSANRIDRFYHDIRTPMTFVNSMIQLANQPATRYIAEKMPQLQQVNGDWKAFSINVLETMLSYIERFQRMFSTSEPLSPALALEMVLKPAEEDASRFGVSIVKGKNVENPELGKIKTKLEDDELDAILSHMINNAIKYSSPVYCDNPNPVINLDMRITRIKEIFPATGQGCYLSQVEETDDATQPRYLAVTVRDFGIGIPEETMQRLLRTDGTVRGENVGEIPGSGKGMFELFYIRGKYSGGLGKQVAYSIQTSTEPSEKSNGFARGTKITAYIPLKV